MGNVCEESNRNFPDDCSNGYEHNLMTEDSFMLEGLMEGASRDQSWHFMDDEFSDDVMDSMNSCDCISEAFCEARKDPGADEDLHYRRTVCVLLKSSRPLIENQCFQSDDYISSFRGWKKGASDGYKPRAQHNMVKKILFAAPLRHGGHSIRPDRENAGKDCLKNMEGCETCKLHSDSDEQRENENFLALGSIVSSINEIDKTSILGNTTNYLRQLESRVAELESCTGSTDYEARSRSYMDMVDRISYNYGIKKPRINKRKARDIDEAELELDEAAPKDDMPLDVLSVHSSTLDGIFTLTLKSKFRGAAVSTAGMIRQALWKNVVKA
ncbi:TRANSCRIPTION FACTOR MYC1 [Salix purpurea]|uniref:TRANSCRIPTION FACTOR MYC1 n=1 Tax=Salix purpurea TaxID=77065 RepID=A0A9Q0P141_SALPP|nr:TRANSCRIPTION FACTOR MYC1 [Salix purpurea]